MARIKTKSHGNVQEEVYDFVSEDDEVLGQATRGEIHARKLIHRSAHVFIVDSQGRIWLQQRSMEKDLYKGFWNSSASGHLDAGEDYDGGGAREFGEEIKNVRGPLVKVGRFKDYNPDDRENSCLFIVRHDGEVEFNREEIQDGRFFGVQEIKDELTAGKRDFTPGFKAAFNKYLEHVGDNWRAPGVPG